MAIQLRMNNKVHRRVLRVFGLEQSYRRILLFLEKRNRRRSKDPLGVFVRYRYATLDLHPSFARLYEHPPVGYVNDDRARLYHWIGGGPDFRDHRPFIVEPNDHPHVVNGCYEPRDALAKADVAREIYLDPNCRRIITDMSGQMNLFRYHFPEPAIQQKIDILPLGMIPKRRRRSPPANMLTFLCLASDFERKAVDIVIEAWLRFPSRKLSRLILVCPDVPPSYEERISGKNVTLIRKAPLTEKERDRLHEASHVSICTWHTDGGANVLEANEFGIPVISMRSQRSDGVRDNKTGVVVDVPFYFYDPGRYGVQWGTWADFFAELRAAKRKGEFDRTVQDMADSFQQFFENRPLIDEMGERAYTLACGPLSLEYRNRRLREIYSEILDGQS